MTNIEFSRKPMLRDKTVNVRGQNVTIEVADLRALGCPPAIARRQEKRMAEAQLAREERARKLKRLEIAMTDDKDKRNQLRADFAADEIAGADVDEELGELSDVERCIIRAHRAALKQVVVS